MTLMKKTDKGSLIYIYNNQRESGFFELELRNIPAGGAYIYNAEEDRHYRLGQDLRFDIEGYGAKLIELFDNKIEAEDYRLADALPPSFNPPYEESPEWDYIPPVKNLKAVLRDWDIAINGKSFGKNRYTLIRDLAGTNLAYLAAKEPRPHFDIAPALETPYPAETIFSASFDLETEGETRLLAESQSFAGKCSVYINGHKVNSFLRVRRYDPWNIEAEISSFCYKGKNEITIKWKKAGEFDGLRSIIYIY